MINRFSLDARQRAYLIFTLAANVFAYGHATRDLINNHMISESIVDTTTLASLLTLTMSITSIAVTVIKSKEKNRNTLVWASKGLLGGPFTVFQLNELDEL